MSLIHHSLNILKAFSLLTPMEYKVRDKMYIQCIL